AHKPAPRANLQASVLFSRCSFFKVLCSPSSRDSFVIIPHFAKAVNTFLQKNLNMGLLFLNFPTKPALLTFPRPECRNLLCTEYIYNSAAAHTFGISLF
ncbi:hypothetical protein, partial [Anaerotruncus rubiinfantis]|uniref:hypothetical protein n=1 Tax=Anaerotruncus rubiinfantis TaxID=1720200 RepID=UPI0034A3B806